MVSRIFPNEVSVGASAGIFGLLGIAVIFLIIFSMLSLLLGLSSFIHHFSAFVIGLIAGLMICRWFPKSGVEG